jgi:hypothetical protein
LIIDERKIMIMGIKVYQVIKGKPTKAVEVQIEKEAVTFKDTLVGFLKCCLGVGWQDLTITTEIKKLANVFKTKKEEKENGTPKCSREIIRKNTG